MKPTTTRTLNPLPFQDLEPHRFEDLIRQLAYDLRRWKSLEATGRSGSDEGLDIRGIELVPATQEPEEEGEEDETPISEERLWVFQCKRETSLSPKRVHEIVEESLGSLAVPPHGFVLAVACDVSKKARDNFREEMVARAIEEFAIWAKGELEDMLFQSKNDRLLFAYFGLSLQPRRRSLTTTLRSQIAKKKQLTALLGEESDQGKIILLRDPTDERYPREPEKGELPARWLACRAISMKKPGHLAILRHEYFAATTPDREGWDAILTYDNEEAAITGELRAANAWNLEDQDHLTSTPHAFWNEYIAEQDRAYLKVYLFVSLDRILAVDPLGDGFFPIPHVLVEFDDKTGPFVAREFTVLDRAHPFNGRLSLEPQKSNRVEIFPNPLPGEFEEPPKAFDHTGEAAVPLSATATEKLTALFATLAERRQEAPVTPRTEEDRLGGMDTKVKSFCEWRNRVALPVFSAFVHRLRAEGHTARVVIRSPDPERHQHQALESVELRVQLHVGRPFYRPSGHIRVSIADYTGWHVEVTPIPDETRGHYSQVKSEAMEQEQLEERILLMLQRLQSHGY